MSTKLKKNNIFRICLNIGLYELLIAHLPTKNVGYPILNLKNLNSSYFFKYNPPKTIITAITSPAKGIPVSCMGTVFPLTTTPC
jgi:hypothetical protein